ncbi:hypothetical protein BBJ28_00008156 [Nothophytophthora sp. Chile5]|nr:hypothetical protein BBJ28_00008156 [Nothophytophthora sp. Chile5]
MELAQKVVADIVARCRYRGVEVSETLAAFTARLVVHRSRRQLVLEQPMTPDDELFLVEQCEKALLRSDDPALETVKMQLEFDFTYANLEEELRARRERKAEAVAKLQRSIAVLVPEKASDFETLSTLYKHIFSLLMLDADSLNASNDNDEDTGKSNNNSASKQQAERRAVEKEVAAALESVFPRIGLKSFATMTAEDKRFQLDELMRIVEGIRLFNKELGKGGAGISASAGGIQDNVETLAKQVREEVRDANEVCTQYTEVLLHVHHQLGDDLDASDPPPPSADEISRWQDELGNRRQFLSYLQSLEEDIAFSHEKVGTRLQMFQTDMRALQSLVGARSSLPKSHVYPLFEAVSRSWTELQQEHELLQARARALRALMRFKTSFTRSLSPDSPIARRARRGGSIPTEELFSQLETFPAEKQLTDSDRNDAKGRSFGSSGADDDDAALDDDDSNPNEEEGSGFPIRMPVDSTPEFMQLPLEYQGFCPWTVVERGGLLLPGDPSLGVVQYRNAYHVFVNERALGEFMIHPRRYVQGVLHLATRQPALIYLLRLQEAFPNITLAALLKMCHRFRSEGAHPLLAPAPSQKVDASTATPTHFVEKRLDCNYDWNEWSLRRKAIKIANLRHCRTVGAQTALSSFRREVDTQVYLPTDSSCQTSHTRGTNPPRTVTFFAGLRSGHVYDVEDAKRAEAKEAKDAAAGGDHKTSRRYDDESKERDNQPAVVSFSFDL